MKNLYLILLINFCLSMNIGFSQPQPQLQKWYMNYFEVDFSGSTPQMSSLPFAHPSHPNSAPNRLANVGNGIHDLFGNLLFYTVWDDTNPTSSGYRHQIYNSTSNLIGNLYVEADGTELSIVPFGDLSPDKYLIIYPAQRGAGATRFLDYVIIDMAANGGQGAMSVGYPVAAPGAGNPTPICTVGQQLADGTRYLYANVKKDIKKYVIDFSFDALGYPDLIISPALNPIVHTFSQSPVASEIELLHTGSSLALAEAWTNKVHVIDLDLNGDFLNYQLFTVASTVAFNEFVTGVEFDMTGDKLFVNFNRPSNCPSAMDAGIYVIDLNSGAVSPTPISSSQNYSRSHLELAHDGYIYAGGYFKDVEESRLARIDPIAETILAEYVLPDILPFVGDYRGYNCHPGYPGRFTLPDQIDGDIVLDSKEITWIKNMQIYPNPVITELTLVLPEELKGEKIWIEFYNVWGKVVHQASIDPTGNRQTSIDIGHLPAGWYTILGQHPRQYHVVGKFVKE